MKKSIFIGFDGYLDQILYPIASISSTDKNHIYFNTISELGNYLISKSGKSCNLQLELKSKQLGGNGPIFGRTLKSLGCDIKIAGMFGNDSINPVFSEVFDSDQVISFLDPMHSDALEFKDGKVMMCPTAPTIASPLSLLENAAKNASYNIEDALKSDLLAFLNWGEIGFMQKLWEEIYFKFFECSETNKNKLMFFDPADISQRTANEVTSMLKIIRSYSSKRYTILSINENEAIQIGLKLYNNDDTDYIINQLPKDFLINELVIHSNYKTISSVSGTRFELPTDHIESPLISTGAGDNFNAGYCYGKINNMSPIDCIRMAHKASSFYITHAKPIQKSDF